MMLERVEMFISMIDNMLNTKQKRHIIGGILLSAAFFFGGLALTAISIKNGGNIWIKLYVLSCSLLEPLLAL